MRCSVTPAAAVTTLDERYFCTAMTYRLEKKRVLAAAAARLDALVAASQAAVPPALVCELAPELPFGQARALEQHPDRELGLVASAAGITLEFALQVKCCAALPLPVLPPARAARVTLPARKEAAPPRACRSARLHACTPDGVRVRAAGHGCVRSHAHRRPPRPGTSDAGGGAEAAGGPRRPGDGQARPALPGTQVHPWRDRATGILIMLGN